MPDRKLQDDMCYPPRGMRADRAAAYLGISQSLFLEMLSTGEIEIVPVRFRSVVTYDRHDLDVIYQDMKRRSEEEGRNTIDERLGMSDGEDRAGLRPRVPRQAR